MVVIVQEEQGLGIVRAPGAPAAVTPDDDVAAALLMDFVSKADGAACVPEHGGSASGGGGTGGPGAEKEYLIKWADRSHIRNEWVRFLCSDIRNEPVEPHPQRACLATSAMSGYDSCVVTSVTSLFGHIRSECVRFLFPAASAP